MVNVDKRDGLWFKYFIIQPAKIGPHGEASRVALRAYANVIKKSDSQLAKEVDDWLNQIEEKLKSA